MALICDTGLLYAAMDRSDTDHGICARLLTSSSEQLLVPGPVVVELDWLVGRRLGPAAFDPFLADVEERAVRVIELQPADYRRARALCTRYRDLPLGFVDAAVVALAERLGEDKLATLDRRHFAVVRTKSGQPLRMLPEPA